MAFADPRTVDYCDDRLCASPSRALVLRENLIKPTHCWGYDVKKLREGGGRNVRDEDNLICNCGHHRKCSARKGDTIVDTNGRKSRYQSSLFDCNLCCIRRRRPQRRTTLRRIIRPRTAAKALRFNPVNQWESGAIVACRVHLHRSATAGRSKCRVISLFKRSTTGVSWGRRLSTAGILDRFISTEKGTSQDQQTRPFSVFLGACVFYCLCSKFTDEKKDDGDTMDTCR